MMMALLKHLFASIRQYFPLLFGVATFIMLMVYQHQMWFFCAIQGILVGMQMIYFYYMGNAIQTTGDNILPQQEVTYNKQQKDYEDHGLNQYESVQSLILALQFIVFSLPSDAWFTRIELIAIAVQMKHLAKLCYPRSNIRKNIEYSSQSKSDQRLLIKVFMGELLITFGFTVYLFLHQDSDENITVNVFTLVVVIFSLILQFCNLIDFFLVKPNVGEEKRVDPQSKPQVEKTGLMSFIRESNLFVLAHLQFSTINQNFQIIDPNEFFHQSNQRFFQNINAYLKNFTLVKTSQHEFEGIECNLFEYLILVLQKMKQLQPKIRIKKEKKKKNQEKGQFEGSKYAGGNLDLFNLVKSNYGHIQNYMVSNSQMLEQIENFNSIIQVSIFEYFKSESNQDLIDQNQVKESQPNNKTNDHLEKIICRQSKGDQIIYYMICLKASRGKKSQDTIMICISEGLNYIPLQKQDKSEKKNLPQEDANFEISILQNFFLIQAKKFQKVFKLILDTLSNDTRKNKFYALTTTSQSSQPRSNVFQANETENINLEQNQGAILGIYTSQNEKCKWICSFIMIIVNNNFNIMRCFTRESESESRLFNMHKLIQETTLKLQSYSGYRKLSITFEHHCQWNQDNQQLKIFNYKKTMRQFIINIMQVVKSIIKLNKRNNESLNNVGIWYHLVDSEIIELWIVINEAEFPTIYRTLPDHQKSDTYYKKQLFDFFAATEFSKNIGPILAFHYTNIKNGEIKISVQICRNVNLQDSSPMKILFIQNDVEASDEINFPNLQQK